MRRAVLAALLAGPALPAAAACSFDADGEITNPFAAGCGDVLFTYTDADNAGTGIALGYPPPVPVASMTPVAGFREYASLFAQHQSLLALNDEVDGEVVGETVAGREIWAYVVGDVDASTSEGFAEPAVLVNGGIHAREWQTPEAVTAVFEALVAGKADGGFVQYLVENLNTVLVPVNNVDGFVQAQLYPASVTADREQPREGRMRRKNLRNPETTGAIDSDIGTVADNFWGVDLNRNAARGFGLRGGSASLVTSLIYHGTAPDSEPEFRALQQAATLGPESRLRLYSDTHSFGQVYLAPTPPNVRLNAITQALGVRMAEASGRNYGYGPDAQGSPGIGTTADHFTFTYQIPGWTLELEPANGAQDYGGLATHGHSGFILPDAEVARMRDDVARQYLLGFYRQSGPPAAIAAEIRERPGNGVVYRARWRRTGPAGRALDVEVNEALVPGGDYRLWVAFNKPMRVRDGAGAVVPYAGQSPGASIGTATLRLPSLDGTDVALGEGAWLADPGGAPGGYLRYADDAFAIDFTLPATLVVDESTPAALALSIQDLAQMALDADPASAVDWGDGHWLRYENSQGTDGDSGGADCSFRPFVAAAAGAAPPAGEAECIAAEPPPPPPPPPRSGGGGHGDTLLLLLAALLPILRKRKPNGATRSRSPFRIH